LVFSIDTHLPGRGWNKIHDSTLVMLVAKGLSTKNCCHSKLFWCY